MGCISSKTGQNMICNTKRITFCPPPAPAQQVRMCDGIAQGNSHVLNPTHRTHTLPHYPPTTMTHTNANTQVLGGAVPQLCHGQEVQAVCKVPGHLHGPSLCASHAIRRGGCRGSHDGAERSKMVMRQHVLPTVLYTVSINKSSRLRSPAAFGVTSGWKTTVHTAA